MKRKGFTLIELLVVIAIIGILATVLLVNLSTGRDKAKATSALESLRSAQSVAVACDGTVNKISTASGGGVICTGGTETWPTLTSPWTYDAAGVGASGSITMSDTAGFAASNGTATSSWTITCDNNGCQKGGGW